MKNLLKTYEIKTDAEYYEIICASLINGQREQAKNQFLAMPKAKRKDFTIWLLDNQEPLIHINHVIFFINLI